ncbi:hypothetical protein Taro_009020 [Colocasia esculenta]|uniref:Uncharacterized protein n=1 Tax=Colocasia esculenta TaxID=4460 RepID=A0A843TZ55_COLES|nr:hypothetical protein [Colocasia esculenta]
MTHTMPWPHSPVSVHVPRISSTCSRSPWLDDVYAYCLLPPLSQCLKLIDLLASEFLSVSGSIPYVIHGGIEKVEVEASTQKVAVTGYVHRNKVLKALRRGGLKAEFWSAHNEILINAYARGSFSAFRINNFIRFF